MPRTFLILALSASLSTFAFAQDKPDAKGDPIAAELEAAKVKYRTAVETARKKLLQSFADEDRRIAADPKLKPEEKLKRLDQLTAENQAFEADDTLPKSVSLSKAVTIYLDELKPAREACEKAFDTAANKYLVTDRTAAKAVLAVKLEFFKVIRVERVRPFLHFASRDDHVELDQTFEMLALNRPFTIEIWTRWDTEIVDKRMYFAGDEVWAKMSDQIAVAEMGGRSERVIPKAETNNRSSSLWLQPRKAHESG